MYRRLSLVVLMGVMLAGCVAYPAEPGYYRSEVYAVPVPYYDYGVYRPYYPYYRGYYPVLPRYYYPRPPARYRSGPHHGPYYRGYR